MSIAMISFCIAGVVLIAGEVIVVKSYKREGAFLSTPSTVDLRRVCIKAYAFCITMGMLYALYVLLPEYKAEYYINFIKAFHLYFPIVFIIGLLYIAFYDSRMPKPEDGLYHFGRFMLLQWRGTDTVMISDYIRSVALRAFFIPLMTALFVFFIGQFLEGPEAYIAKETLSWPEGMAGLSILKVLLTAYFFLMALDILFGMIGYLSFFRAIDAGVKSTETTIVGWIVCIICYYPFFDAVIIPIFLAKLFLNPEWFIWFENNPVLLFVWGIGVVTAMCMESFGTMTFGLRFSNLTYRGLITSGLFRYTKHPQYVAKMFNRFFVCVPFLSPTGTAGAIETLIAFFILCVIYYLRARTEENHLSRYPEYVEYALAMNERSVFRPVAAVLPFLKFDPEKAKRGALV